MQPHSKRRLAIATESSAPDRRAGMSDAGNRRAATLSARQTAIARVSGSDTRGFASIEVRVETEICRFDSGTGRVHLTLVIGQVDGTDRHALAVLDRPVST